MAIRLDHGADELTEVHDINVTPFIDVMLVLLIIFMVVAPLATVDVAVNLPGSNAKPIPGKIYLTLKSDLSLVIRDHPISRTSLTSELDAVTGSNKDETIFLRADRSVQYGEVMQLMNDLRSAGYLKMAFVGMDMRDVK
jgi:biopolymer transport protein ExbD